VLVTTSTMAMRLGLMRNTLGNKEFPDITINGGFLEGIPVITSENIAAPTGSPFDGTLIVAINANEVMLADEGGIEIDVSREASLQMDSAPDSPETASTIAVSLWQHNMVAFKAERFINWKKRRAEAVQYISGAELQVGAELKGRARGQVSRARFHRRDDGPDHRHARNCAMPASACCQATRSKPPRRTRRSSSAVKRATLGRPQPAAAPAACAGDQGCAH
jgi:hypothetical protein